ncbi:MAG TPA: RHS repeat domain-containing protein [Gemmata sp.]|nr:RHS repeat domain-containing protein [Gemmata sp.]
MHESGRVAPSIGMIRPAPANIDRKTPRDGCEGIIRGWKGGIETTAWIYGVTQGSGSAITSNDIVGKTDWPDPSTGAASSSEEETTTVNALGQTLTATDRNGNVHTLSYDVLGRVTSDAVTTLASGVDGSVPRIDTAYDGQGNAYLITSYDAADVRAVTALPDRVEQQPPFSRPFELLR